MTTPFLNAYEACDVLGFVDRVGRPQVEAFQRFLVRHPELRAYKRGRTVRYHIDDLKDARRRSRMHHADG